MRDADFKSYLLSDKNVRILVKSICSTINIARMVERYFKKSIDNIVNNNDVIWALAKNKSKDERHK